MFWNDIFEQILDIFCNSNCDSSLLAGGNLTLAVFGRWPIYFMKWARYYTCCTWCWVCVCEKATQTKRQSGRGTNRGQVGVIAHSHYSCLSLSPTGHDYKALGDHSALRLTLAACPLPLLSSHPNFLHSSLVIYLSVATFFYSASPTSQVFMFSQWFIYVCRLTSVKRLRQPDK